MNKIKILLSCIVLLGGLLACDKAIEPTPIVFEPSPIQSKPTSDEAQLWGKMTLQVLDKLPSNTPVFASRGLGYIGLTMYESVVNGSQEYQSLGLQLNNFPTMPRPARGQPTNWVLAMNAGQASIIKSLFSFASAEKLAKVDSLEAIILKRNSIGKPVEEVERSVSFGKAIAEAIFNWAKQDGGHMGNTRNFDPNYRFPFGDGYWQPPLLGQLVSSYPLQPYWGQNRTFAVSNSKLPMPSMIPFSALVGSDYYNQFMEVYNVNLKLTQSQSEIAAWWADDPSETFSPPGHSYSIANQVIAIQKADLFLASATYAKVGMAVADAFINCWKTKYHYHCQRPYSYIARYINNTYQQFWPEPPFPAFYSGHSVQGSAAATVLESIYGKTYAFTDNSHLNRPRSFIRNIEYKPRKYESFKQFAIESGYSRILGGIHTPLDNEVGLAEGIKVGENIIRLPWKR
jgi:hypothetical protein